MFISYRPKKEQMKSTPQFYSHRTFSFIIKNSTEDFISFRYVWMLVISCVSTLACLSQRKDLNFTPFELLVYVEINCFFAWRDWLSFEDVLAVKLILYMELPPGLSRWKSFCLRLLRRSNWREYCVYGLVIYCLISLVPWQ